jgi:hypothetical protein
MLETEDKQESAQARDDGGRRRTHSRRSAHILFPIIVWIESGWVFFGTLAFISATFYVLGNMQDFTAQTLELLVSGARWAGLLCSLFTVAYLLLTLAFRAAGGPRRRAHLALASIVLFLALVVTISGFALESLVRPVG